MNAPRIRCPTLPRRARRSRSPRRPWPPRPLRQTSSPFPPRRRGASRPRICTDAGWPRQIRISRSASAMGPPCSPAWPASTATANETSGATKMPSLRPLSTLRARRTRSARLVVTIPLPGWRRLAQARRDEYHHPDARLAEEEVSGQRAEEDGQRQADADGAAAGGRCPGAGRDADACGVGESTGRVSARRQLMLPDDKVDVQCRSPARATPANANTIGAVMPAPTARTATGAQSTRGP